MLLVFPVVFDPTFTVLRRLRRHENIFVGHRSFLFHRMIISGLSQVTVTTRYLAFAVVGALLAIAWSQGAPGVRTSSLVLAPALCLGLWVIVLYEEQHSAPGGVSVRKHPARALERMAGDYIVPRLVRYGPTFARDSVLVLGSILVAELLRYNGHMTVANVVATAYAAPLIILVFCTALYLYSIHRRIWEYAGLRDLRALIDACVIVTVVLAVADVVTPRQHLLSLAVVLAGGFIALGSLLFVRLWRRLWQASGRPDRHAARVLIAGAGLAGNQIAAEMLLTAAKSHERPVGFLDDIPVSSITGYTGCRSTARWTSCLVSWRRRQSTRLSWRCPPPVTM